MLAHLNGKIDPTGARQEAPHPGAGQKLRLIDPPPTLDNFTIESALGAAPEARHAEAKESSKYRRQSDPWAHFDRPSGHFQLQRAITRLRPVVIGGERDTPCFPRQTP
jgi:hypothetical protein